MRRVHGEQVPARLAHRQAELRRLLNQWDPLGVYDELLDFPPNEYDCMEGRLLALLESGADEAEIGDYLRSELVDHFGLRPDACNRADFARRLVEWFGSPRPNCRSGRFS